jgi:hypothetical protein
MRRTIGFAAALMLLVVASRAGGAGQATPYLQLVGTIPIAGQATVVGGDTARAFGSGFCGSAGCSPVTIKIEDHVVARGLDVTENGSFRASFRVAEEPGRYTVTASQTAAGGGVLEDSAPLVVAIGDVEEEAVPGIDLQVVSAAHGVFVATTHPRRCCARTAALFQRRAANGHWWTLRRVRLNRHGARRFTAALPLGATRVRIVLPKRHVHGRQLASRAVLVRR